MIKRIIKIKIKIKIISSGNSDFITSGRTKTGVSGAQDPVITADRMYITATIG